MGSILKNYSYFWVFTVIIAFDHWKYHFGVLIIWKAFSFWISLTSEFEGIKIATRQVAAYQLFEDKTE